MDVDNSVGTDWEQGLGQEGESKGTTVIEQQYIFFNQLF